jgi:DNA polymerase
MSDKKAQSESGSARDPEVVEKAKAYLQREIETGLDAAPVGTAPAVPVINDAPIVDLGADRVPAESAPPGERPQIRELPDQLVEPAIKAATSLPELREVLGDCRRCKLCDGRTNIVFGTGNPQAELMFVGEAPGANEDEQGIPFIGQAGNLLTNIITNGMGLARDDVYIANIIKCRPPGNRDPEPDEIVACEPFLHRQIGIIRPRVIVTLGKFATQALLRERTPISKLRGSWLDYQGVPVMPTFHPAYLLHNPSAKGIVWSDIQLVMERLGLQKPASKG